LEKSPPLKSRVLVAALLGMTSSLGFDVETLGECGLIAILCIPVLLPDPISPYG
jgi:hypothetical protein